MHIPHSSSCSEWGLCRSRWNLPWKSGCELVKHSLPGVFWGLTCCCPASVCAQVLCVKKEKVIKVIICLHLEVRPQCQRAELSSQPGWAGELCHGASDHFCSLIYLPYHTVLWRDPLLQLRWNSWGFSTISLGFWGMTLPSPSPRRACDLWVDQAVMSAEHWSSAWQTSEDFRGFISSAE